jgi:hypothetical protein
MKKKSNNNKRFYDFAFLLSIAVFVVLGKRTCNFQLDEL